MLPLLLACVRAAPPADVAAPAAPDPDVAALGAAARDGRAFERLVLLCDDAGPRPAGSPGLEKAVGMTAAWLREDGHAVRTEAVTVPVWLRGEERLAMLAPHARELAVLGLGGSVGGAVEAPVVVVRSFDELDARVAGKIVLFDVPMEEHAPAVVGYGSAVAYRVDGASKAAEHGAVAALVRSVTTRSLYTPHTGALWYEEGQPRIPAAAVTAEDSAAIARLTARGVDVRLRLELGARDGGEAVSHNVIAEIPGREAPDEIVLVGAHLDSWDVGQGAHDDGAGVAEVIEAMRLIRAHGTPRRTVRAVLFTNEEHGLSGGKAYAAAHGGERHVAAVETDLGGGRPLAWSASGTPEQMAWLRAVAAPIGLPVEEGGGGADINGLRDHGALVIGLLPDDSHYFDVHHTHADTVDKVDPAALAEATGALAALVWEMAEAP